MITSVLNFRTFTQNIQAVLTITDFNPTIQLVFGIIVEGHPGNIPVKFDKNWRW